MESVLENYSLAFGRLKLVLSMLLFVIVLLIGFWNSGIIWAQETSEDSGLEEVLSGFDDEKLNDEDDVLSGFDDRTDESGSDKDSVSVDDGTSWGQTLGGISGSSGLSASYSYAKAAPVDNRKANWSGLTKLRPYFSLTWDAKFGGRWKTRISGKTFYD